METEPILGSGTPSTTSLGAALDADIVRTGLTSPRFIGLAAFASGLFPFTWDGPTTAPNFGSALAGSGSGAVGVTILPRQTNVAPGSRLTGFAYLFPGGVPRPTLFDVFIGSSNVPPSTANSRGANVPTTSLDLTAELVWLQGASVPYVIYWGASQSPSQLVAATIDMVTGSVGSAFPVAEPPSGMGTHLYLDTLVDEDGRARALITSELRTGGRDIHFWPNFSTPGASTQPSVQFLTGLYSSVAAVDGTVLVRNDSLPNPLWERYGMFMLSGPDADTSAFGTTVNQFAWIPPDYSPLSLSLLLDPVLNSTGTPMFVLYPNRQHAKGVFHLTHLAYPVPMANMGGVYRGSWVVPALAQGVSGWYSQAIGLDPVTAWAPNVADL